MAERTKAKRQAAPAAETETTTARDRSKAAATRTSAAKPAAAKRAATKAAAGRAKADGAASGGKAAPRKSPARKPATGKTQPRPGHRQTRSAAETERIRAALAARRDELREEYALHLAEIAELQRERFTDSAGDDQADTGSKTFEREQEISLANSILERSTQVERALERLDEGSYGWCERCGNAIPVERLAAFPSATLCVSCKQLEERR
jgi:RNA polymerase-binding protein DksA